MNVRYVVDAAGKTLDDQVSVVPELSNTDRQYHFDLFAESALRIVRDWTFVFIDPNDPSCSSEQTQTTTFEFRCRRVGIGCFTSLCRQGVEARGA